MCSTECRKYHVYCVLGKSHAKIETLTNQHAQFNWLNCGCGFEYSMRNLLYLHLLVLTGDKKIYMFIVVLRRA